MSTDRAEGSEARRAGRELDALELGNERRRLPCFATSHACPYRPGLGWACLTCAEQQLGRPIREEEAWREELFLEIAARFGLEAAS